MLTLALLATCALALGAAFAWRVRRVGASLRGPRLVTCPETGLPAAVEIDVRHSAVRSTLGRPHLRLQDCSRWPVRAECGQACRHDLEAAPEDTRVSRILDRFYADKQCALCGWSFGTIPNASTEVAVLGPDGVTYEWSDFAADTLPIVLRSHAPVCWHCHVRRSYRRRHPEIFRSPDARTPSVG